VRRLAGLAEGFAQVVEDARGGAPHAVLLPAVVVDVAVHVVLHAAGRLRLEQPCQRHLHDGVAVGRPIKFGPARGAHRLARRRLGLRRTIAPAPQHRDDRPLAVRLCVEASAGDLAACKDRFPSERWDLA